MPYLECYVGDCSDSEQVLHAVDDGVGGGGHGGVADLQGDGRHSGHTLHELSLHRNKKWAFIIRSFMLWTEFYSEILFPLIL